MLSTACPKNWETPFEVKVFRSHVTYGYIVTGRDRVTAFDTESSRAPGRGISKTKRILTRQPLALKFSPKIAIFFSFLGYFLDGTFKYVPDKMNNKFSPSWQFLSSDVPHGRGRKESDELFVVYGPGHSLWSANRIASARG